jgi:hypothetical protein
LEEELDEERSSILFPSLQILFLHHDSLDFKLQNDAPRPFFLPISSPPSNGSNVSFIVSKMGQKLVTCCHFRLPVRLALAWAKLEKQPTKRRKNSIFSISSFSNYLSFYVFFTSNMIKIT